MKKIIWICGPIGSGKTLAIRAIRDIAHRKSDIISGSIQQEKALRRLNDNPKGVVLIDEFNPKDNELNNTLLFACRNSEAQIIIVSQSQPPEIFKDHVIILRAVSPLEIFWRTEE
jgi:ABC-type glutathione transport system ATPase component